MQFVCAITICLAQAWEETFRNWEVSRNSLSLYPKTKLEDGQIEPFHRSVGKRRASHQNSEHELEVLMLCCFSKNMYIENLMSIFYETVQFITGPN